MNPVGRPMLDSFEETYKRFATIKGLAPLDRPFLDQMAKEGFLELSLAKAPGGEPLAYHVYYCDGDRSCLLHAVSLYQTLTNSATRNAMGRANRYLFWCDILRHRARALKAFDFGGWYPGTTDQGLLDINRFKEEFGGNVVREYNCEQILTLKGHLALSAAAWLDRIQRAAAQLRAGPARPKPQHETADAKPVSSGRSPAAELREVREPELTNG
jgi:hypothetical protein